MKACTSGTLVADLLTISAFLVIMSLAIQVVWLKKIENNTFGIVAVYALISTGSFINSKGIFSNLLDGTWQWNLYLIADFVFEIISFWIIFDTLKRVTHSRIEE